MADKKKAAADAATRADTAHGEHQAAAADYVKNPTQENLDRALKAADESAPAQTDANRANAEARGDGEAYGS